MIAVALFAIYYVHSWHSVLASLIYRSNSKFDETVQMNYHYKGKTGRCWKMELVTISVQFYHSDEIWTHEWLMLFMEREAGHSNELPSVNLAHKTPTISSTHSFDTCYCDVMLSWQPAILYYSSSTQEAILLIMDIKKMQLYSGAAAKYL